VPALTWQEIPAREQTGATAQKKAAGAEPALAVMQQAQAFANLADLRGNISQVMGFRSENPERLALRVAEAVEHIGGSVTMLEGLRPGEIRLLMDVPADQKKVASLAVERQAFRDRAELAEEKRADKETAQAETVDADVAAAQTKAGEDREAHPGEAENVLNQIQVQVFNYNNARLQQAIDAKKKDATAPTDRVRIVVLIRPAKTVPADKGAAAQEPAPAQKAD